MWFESADVKAGTQRAIRTLTFIYPYSYTESE